MTSAANEATARQFFEKITAGKIDDAFALVADDVAWWVPGNLPFSGTKTKTEYMQIVARIQSGFPDGFALRAGDATSAGDRVAIEVESDGRHVSGKRYANRYHFLFVFAGGKIARVKEYMDTQHLKELISG